MAHALGQFPELCQEANLSGNIAAIQAEMPNNIYNEDFDGIAQIDFEVRRMLAATCFHTHAYG
jgi:hypothetical protein